MKKLKIERRIVGKKWYHGNEVINQADPPITKKVTNVVHANMSFTEASYACDEDLDEAPPPVGTQAMAEPMILSLIANKWE